MKIKTKSIIILCLTALASMPLSAQSYLGSVVDIEGTWTTAKNIKVEEKQVVFTDHKDGTHTIVSSHGGSTPVQVIHDVLYCDNDESLTSDQVGKAVKTGQLKLKGTLNNHNWALLNDGKLDGITSARFYKVTGDDTFTALNNLKCSTLLSVTFEDCSFPNVTSLEGLLRESAITSFTWGGMDVSNNLSTLKSMFYSCKSLQSVSLKGLNTSNVTDISALFSGCSALSSIDLSGCDFSNVTDCSGMFNSCADLQSIDLSNLNLKNVTTSSNMFSQCAKLTNIIFTGCDFSKVTDSKNMFQQCNVLKTVNLSGVKLSSKNCYKMFQYCYDLNSVNLSGCNFKEVTSCKEMFGYCIALKEIVLSGCSLECAENASLEYMFRDCSALETVNFSGCDLSKATNHESMFDNCKALKTIKAIGCNEDTITKLQEAKNNYEYLSGVTIVTSESSSTTTE